MTAASACGITFTDLATTTIAKITRTMLKNTSPTTAPCIVLLLCPEGLHVLDHHCGGTVDLHDGHPLPGLEHVVVVEWPRRPHLAVQLHLAFVARDPAEHQGGLALQRLDAGRQPPRGGG